ncbi:MAG: hypothetical protein U1C74_14595 [Phenylobacterium sp.]|nr:hypothetical protein [Phenylobacterium sp.]
MSRPLIGNVPVIEVAAGYRPDNPSPVLKFLLEDIDTLTASRSGQAAVGAD